MSVLVFVLRLSVLVMLDCHSPIACSFKCVEGAVVWNLSVVKVMKLRRVLFRPGCNYCESRVWRGDRESGLS